MTVCFERLIFWGFGVQGLGSSDLGLVGLGFRV